MLEAVEDSLKTIKELPPLPLAARQILRALNSQDVVVTELVSAVELDPVVTARLIAIANSAFFQTTHPCTSTRDAVVRLGMLETKQLLMPIVLASFFDLRKCPHFHADEYWKQILLVAMGARKVVECAGNKIDEQFSQSAYTAGLFHNIGLLALVHLYPKEMNRVFRQIKDINTSYDEVKRMLGIDPAEASYILLSTWGVPEEIYVVARNINSADTASNNDYPALTALIRFMVAWYMQDFCPIEASAELQQIDITTRDLEKAQTLIKRDMPPLVKIASMLYFY